MSSFGLYSSKQKFPDPGTQVARHKNWRDMILQYKSSVIDKCSFVPEYNHPSDERVELAARYTEPVIIQRSKE
ncbi:hypothetical protein PO909_031408, partial [Leuciscus waleckii]